MVCCPTFSVPTGQDEERVMQITGQILLQTTSLKVEGQEDNDLKKNLKQINCH